jgi:hypothetical protein
MSESVRKPKPALYVRGEKAKRLASQLAKQLGTTERQVVEDALDAYRARFAPGPAADGDPLTRLQEMTARWKREGLLEGLSSTVDTLHDPETGLPI